MMERCVQCIETSKQGSEFLVEVNHHFFDEQKSFEG